MSLEGLLKQKLLWGQVARDENVAEEVLVSARQLPLGVGLTVPVTQKGYVKLQSDLAGDLQGVCRGAEATTRKF